MKSLRVIQHTSSEYLGLMEDHFEGRKIRFNYTRPFTEGAEIPKSNEMSDGLVLLGGGPWGTAGTRNVPTLEQEIRLTRAYLMHELPIIAIGLGAQILALAADGKTEAAEYRFEVGTMARTSDRALNGYLPETSPWVCLMRDRFVAPGYAEIIALDSHGDPAGFQIGSNAFGFSGHPAFKLAMAEDMVMEFEEAPVSVGEPFAKLREHKTQIEDCLVSTMTGLIQLTGLMR